MVERYTEGSFTKTIIITRITTYISSAKLKQILGRQTGRVSFRADFQWHKKEMEFIIIKQKKITKLLKLNIYSVNSMTVRPTDKVSC